MDYVIKKASALSQEEQASRGITGIPQDWPVERYPYSGQTPEGFEAITESDYQLLISNNQAAYDAWLQALRPIIAAAIPAPTQVQIMTSKTPDDRQLVAVNRVPPGYTVCNAGRGDDFSTGSYGTGPRLVLDANTPNVDFKMLGHWYGIGGRVIWESASLDDHCSATLIAPASAGFTEAQGDFNKVNLGGPYNMIVPATPGTGAWSADLTAKHANTQVLKAVPVPSTGNVGFFDYNADTNTLTPNLTQTGGYNLYDFDVNIFRFCNSIHGRKQDGAESVTESSDVVGKLLYNTWFVRFSLTAVTQGVRCAPIITVAIKRGV